jgi:glutamate synthase (NADPH) large chain
MVAVEPVGADDTSDHPDLPKQRAPSVEDSGMGDMLRFDEQRLKVLIERHLLHTGSARAKALLDNWAEARGHFVKITPADYRRALMDLKAERQAAVAAE